MFNTKEILYKEYTINTFYEEDGRDYIIQVSKVGKDNLFYCITVEEYILYGEFMIYNEAITKYNQRIAIMEQIG